MHTLFQKWLIATLNAIKLQYILQMYRYEYCFTLTIISTVCDYGNCLHCRHSALTKQRQQFWCIIHTHTCQCVGISSHSITCGEIKVLLSYVQTHSRLFSACCTTPHVFLFLIRGMLWLKTPDIWVMRPSDRKFMKIEEKCESCIYHLWFSFCHSKTRCISGREWAIRKVVCVYVFCTVCAKTIKNKKLRFLSRGGLGHPCFYLHMLNSGSGPQISSSHKY